MSKPKKLSKYDFENTKREWTGGYLGVNLNHKKSSRKPSTKRAPCDGRDT